MAAEDTTSTATLVREVFQRAVEIKFTTDQLLQMFPRRQQAGDTGVRWAVHRTGNTSFTTMTEGDPAPTAGQQGWVEALVPWTWFHGTVSVSGVAAAQIRGGSTAGFPDLLSKSLADGIKDLNDTINTTFLGTTASGTGILDIIDSATTYAGLSRVTYTDWGSYEDTVSGALTLAVMQNMAEGIRDNDRAGRLTLIASRTNQISNYQNLAGASNTLANISRIVMTGPGVDFGAPRERTAFEGAPWIELYDIANTVVLGLDTTPGNWEFVEASTGVQVDPLGRTRFYDDLHVVWGGALVCYNPRKQGKATGVTA